MDNRPDHVLNRLPAGVGYEDVTDWQPYLTTAIGSGAKEVNLPGGTLNFATKRGGTEALKNMVEIMPGLRLIGRGVGETILRVDDSVPSDTPLLRGADCSDAVLAGFTIDGNKARLAAGDRGKFEDEGINVKGGSRIILRDLYIHDCGQEAIDVDTGFDVLVSNVTAISNGGCAVHAVGTGVTRLIIEGCISRLNAIDRYANNTGAVQDQATGFGAAGTDVKIANCISSGDQRGMVLSSVSRGQVVGCTVEEAVTSAISSDSAGSNDVSIVSNDVYGLSSASGDGIRIAGGNYIHVAANKVRKVGSAYRIVSGSYISVCGNQAGNIDKGYQVEGGTGWSIQGNRSEGAQYGVHLAAGGGTVIGNVIRTSAQQGIDVRGPITDVTVMGNRSLLSSNYGLRLLNSGGAPTGIVVVNNDLQGTAGGLSDGGTSTIKQANVLNGVWTA